MKYTLTALTLLVSLTTQASEDLLKIADLLPTTYFTAQEQDINCKGSYRGVEYDGSELSEVLTPKGDVIAEVCTRFYKILCMEGSGILADRGEGPITVNWAGKQRFEVQKRCLLGHGISSQDCLLPHHTIAADTKVHKVGEIVYIPDAKDVVLPDGSLHSGYFIVLDTGSAFNGIGHQRVDLFVGLENDTDNVFKNQRGFHHKNPIKAFKVQGQTRLDAFELLKQKFGDLLSDRHIKK